MSDEKTKARCILDLRSAQVQVRKGETYRVMSLGYKKVVVDENGSKVCDTHSKTFRKYFEIV